MAAINETMEGIEHLETWASEAVICLVSLWPGLLTCMDVISVQVKKKSKQVKRSLILPVTVDLQ